MQKIFLIGYMGAGKTAVGKLLAKKMDLTFIDVDVFIENHYRKSITTIFEEEGEPGFRAIERRALLELIAFEDTVISTGGGMPCFFDNMDIMNKTGITVYLKVSVEELVRRLHSGKQKRPLIKDKNAEELYEFVSRSLEKREVFYGKAAVIFDVMDGNTDIDADVDKLINKLYT
ncbi:MAG: shikimate kinase [Candidatus Symbiothrix sp.]|jgi:shikimate kinase|nr:shikimate kinase [Candidatus Symbiothrix sp.]